MMMPEQEFKIRGDAPRVIPSRLIPEDGTAYFIPGNQFEDGRSRMVIGFAPSPSEEEEITRALDEADRVRARNQAVLRLSDFLAGDFGAPR